MISSVVNRSRWQRNDFCLLWTVVVDRFMYQDLKLLYDWRIYDFICREQTSLTT